MAPFEKDRCAQVDWGRTARLTHGLPETLLRASRLLQQVLGAEQQPSKLCKRRRVRNTKYGMERRGRLLELAMGVWAETESAGLPLS